MSKRTTSGVGGVLGWTVVFTSFVMGGGVVDDDGRILAGAATIVGKGRRRGVGRMRSLVLVPVVLGWVGTTDGSTGTRLDGRTMGVQSLFTRLSSVVGDGDTMEETARSSSAPPPSEFCRIRALKSVPAAVGVGVGGCGVVVDTGRMRIRLAGVRPVEVVAAVVVLVVVVVAFVVGTSAEMVVHSVADSGKSVCNMAPPSNSTSIQTKRQSLDIENENVLSQLTFCEIEDRLILRLGWEGCPAAEPEEEDEDLGPFYSSALIHHGNRSCCNDKQ